MLVQRSDKVAFFGVVSENTTTYTRMKGFTELSSSKNPTEYSRRYVDEAFEQTDVTGYAPSIAYSFDQMTDNAVHADIASATDAEMLGTDMVRSILIVDFSAPHSGGGYTARKRDFSIIPDSEGGSNDAYTYSGTFRAKGNSVAGKATVTDDGATATFTPDEN